MTSLTWRFTPITDIPPALSLITTLRELCLSDNDHLRVGSASAKPLLGLQHLTLLELSDSLNDDMEAANQDFANSLPHSCTVQWFQAY